MIAHAEAQFALSKPTPDGLTQRDHLQAHARSTGEIPAELMLPEIPRGCVGLWNTFIELHNSRANTGMGPTGISFSDLLAWQQLTGVTLSPWELETILRIDQVAVASLSQKAPK